ncbi:hypothetical protein P5V15_009116 [Pogonomyrmex californicus]
MRRRNEINTQQKCPLEFVSERKYALFLFFFFFFLRIIHSCRRVILLNEFLICPRYLRSLLLHRYRPINRVEKNSECVAAALLFEFSGDLIRLVFQTHLFPTFDRHSRVDRDLATGKYVIIGNCIELYFLDKMSNLIEQICKIQIHRSMGSNSRLMKTRSRS